MINQDTQAQLKTVVLRLERFLEERKAINEDIQAVYAEAKSNGFDVPALKEVIKLRAKDPKEVEEAEFMVDTYMNALGA